MPLSAGGLDRVALFLRDFKAVAKHPESREGSSANEIGSFEGLADSINETGGVGEWRSTHRTEKALCGHLRFGDAKPGGAVQKNEKWRK